MKILTRSITVIATAALLGACAGQPGCTAKREYRNPYLRARHIPAPVEAIDKGDLSCMAQSAP